MTLFLPQHEIPAPHILLQNKLESVGFNKYNGKHEALEIQIILMCFSEDHERKLDLIACQRTEEKVFKINLTGSKMTSDH